jgi:hypothetical protein
MFTMTRRPTHSTKARPLGRKTLHVANRGGGRRGIVRNWRPSNVVARSDFGRGLAATRSELTAT